jgi:hypothetical protein
MIDFVPHPGVALNRASKTTQSVVYRNDYEAIFRDIANGILDQRAAFRALVLDDLFFILYFVMGIEKANHPFVVKVAKMVSTGARSDTLDIWSRFHYKSSLLTIAETVQFTVANPEKCTGIFAYSRPAAKKFLIGLKTLFEQNDLLKTCFPDVVWSKPESESPKWSLDEGLVFKRKGASRGESNIEAWGLTEGMPTGRHFERCVFDDLETEDIRDSPDMLNKVYSKFEMAANLGTGSDDDIVRVIGTYYSHYGPNVRIRDMKYADGRNVYKLRLIPGSDDGTREGNPVLVDKNTWAKLKTSSHFNSQQLCDPTPSTEVKLDFTYLKPIENKLIPREVYKFMVIDQAGGGDDKTTSKDMWSYGVVGVEPCMDEIGQSKVYLMDIEADKMTHSEGIDGIVRMYLSHGVIHQLGVEKTGMSTTEIHITNALRARGRRVSADARNLVVLKPVGRTKQFRVESALQWPLNNGMLYYSTTIHNRYIEMIKEEMNKFPFYHVDILDMWAYVYDMIKAFRFVDYRDFRDYEEEWEEPIGRSAVTGY